MSAHGKAKPLLREIRLRDGRTIDEVLCHTKRGMAAAHDLSGILHSTFGHREFRPHQQEVCEAAAAGRDVLLVMPTGAGKSLCYQLPAMALGGTAVVISPLIALMDDQAGKLTSLGLRVARIHSGRSREDSRQACRDYLARLRWPEGFRCPRCGGGKAWPDWARFFFDAARFPQSPGGE